MIAPFIDVIFLLMIFFIIFSSLVVPSAATVRLPKAVTSDTIREENFVVTITSEDVMTLNGEVVTIKELRAVLSGSSTQNRPLLIKADRRSSVGRVIDVWDLGRDLGLERVNIATTSEQ